MPEEEHQRQKTKKDIVEIIDKLPEWQVWLLKTIKEIKVKQYESSIE